MADKTRSLWLSTDDDFEGPYTPTEAKSRIAEGLAAGKDLSGWQLYEKFDFQTSVVVAFGNELAKGKK